MPAPTPASSPVPQSFRAYASLSVAGGHAAALHELDGSRLELLVGTGVADLVPAEGVEPILGARTSFPAIHVGTDARGRAVVTYPRCVRSGKDSAPVRDCDLFVYDVASAKERRIAETRRPARDEFEAVMDRGALLYSAQAARLASTAADAGLWYRPAGGRDRRIAQNPGRELALRGTRIAQVITDGAKAGEEPCDNSTLVLRSTRGAARAIARDCLYPYGYDPYGRQDAWASPSFAGSRLYWARITGARPNVFRLDLATAAIDEARLRVNLFGFQATGRGTGAALVLTAGVVPPDSEWVAADAVLAVDRLTWTPRTKTLLKDVVFVEPHPLA